MKIRSQVVLKAILNLAALEWHVRGLTEKNTLRFGETDKLVESSNLLTLKNTVGNGENASERTDYKIIKIYIEASFDMHLPKTSFGLTRKSLITREHEALIYVDDFVTPTGAGIGNFRKYLTFK